MGAPGSALYEAAGVTQEPLQAVGCVRLIEEAELRRGIAKLLSVENAGAGGAIPGYRKARRGARQRSAVARAGPPIGDAEPSDLDLVRGALPWPARWLSSPTCPDALPYAR